MCSILFDVVEPLERKSSEYKNLQSCLACGSAELSRYLDLGNQPLANDFMSPETELETFPLVLQCCLRCFHSQLSVSVDPSRLFRNYLYVSNTTATLRNYFVWFADEIVSKYGSGLNILELASNDGTLLKTLSDRGHYAIGVDPALNLLPHVVGNGAISICDFWPGMASRFLENSSDLVIAMNVVAHVPDPCGFLIAARHALKPGGRIVVQTSQADMIESSQFDTAYHEHLSFFNVQSMKALASRSGLQLNDVTLVPIHGKSYLWVLSADHPEISERVKSRLDHELQVGLFSNATYTSFSETAKGIAQKTSGEVARLRESGHAIWGYGAAAKGNTFLNFAKIDLDGFFDDNELKQGLKSPGGNALVYGPQTMKEIQNPICFVVPAWNFVTEISNRIIKLRQNNRDCILTYYPSIQLRSVTEIAEGL